MEDLIWLSVLDTGGIGAGLGSQGVQGSVMSGIVLAHFFSISRNLERLDWNLFILRGVLSLFGICSDDWLLISVSSSCFLLVFFCFPLPCWCDSHIGFTDLVRSFCNPLDLFPGGV